MTRSAPDTHNAKMDVKHLLSLEWCHERHRCVDSMEDVKTMTRSAPSARKATILQVILSAPWASPLRGLDGGGEDNDALGAQRAQQRQRHQRLVRARAHHFVLSQLPRQRIPGITALLSHELQHEHYTQCLSGTSILGKLPQGQDLPQHAEAPVAAVPNPLTMPMLFLGCAP